MKTVNNFVQSERQPFTNSVRSFLPQYAIIPFTQMNGESYISTVKENDHVTEGQIIAVNGDSKRSSDGAAIHSPVPGRVTEILTCSLPNGKMSKAAKIHISGNFTFLGKKQTAVEWKNYSADDLHSLLNEKGVVNTFADTVPLAEEITESKKHADRILAVRLFDEDPSRMTDSFIGVHYHEQIVQGALILAKAMGAEGIVFAVSKYDGIDFDTMKMAEEYKLPCFMVSIETKKYPSGFKQNIIEKVKHEAKGDKDSVFNRINRKSVFVDSETVYSVYEAVVFGIPVVERFVHVTGTCLRSAGLFKVRIGTTVRSLAEQCGGFKITPAKIIVNGMITGFAISSLDTPITKQVKSIMFVPANELNDQDLSPCIRCGNCRSICPEGIFPDLIFRHQTGGKTVGMDLVETAKICSGCCLCNSVCPARLPLCQTIALMKEGKHE